MPTSRRPDRKEMDSLVMLDQQYVNWLAYHGVQSFSLVGQNSVSGSEEVFANLIQS
jgi:hypothetical protein